MDVSLHMSITRSHADLEYLISRWSTKTHTFVTSWGEFTPIPKDVSVIFRLQVSVDDGAMGFIMFDKERGKVPSSFPTNLHIPRGPGICTLSIILLLFHPVFFSFFVLS